MNDFSNHRDEMATERNENDEKNGNHDLPAIQQHRTIINWERWDISPS